MNIFDLASIAYKFSRNDGLLPQCIYCHKEWLPEDSEDTCEECKHHECVHLNYTSHRDYYGESGDTYADCEVCKKKCHFLGW